MKTSQRHEPRITWILIPVLLCISVPPSFAELQPLLFAGQPGILIDTNQNGVQDPGEGMVTAMYDIPTAVIVLQADESIGGGVAIYQITEQFDTQVLAEISQFPPTGPPQFVSSKSEENFVTFFLDTVDFMPPSAPLLLKQLLGSGQ